jgi:hypothetical protein
VRGGDADGGCTGSEDRRPTARCWLDGNGARENTARSSPTLEAG